jgi:acetyl esterase/lipase
VRLPAAGPPRPADRRQAGDNAEGGPEIASQVLVYPVTDSGMETPSYRDPENQFLLTRETMRWFWELYVPDPADGPIRQPRSMTCCVTRARPMRGGCVPLGYR